MNMWHHYRSTLIPMQLFTLTTCAVIYWAAKAPLFAVFVLFLVMQIGLVLGAAWGARLLRRKRAREDMLPLQNRRW